MSPGSAPTTVVILPNIRCTITAALIGGDFDITPDRPIPQSFLETRVLSWHWQVRPKRSGRDLNLQLHLQWTEEQPGRQPRLGPDQTYDATINVDAVDRPWHSKAWRWISEFFGNPAVQALFVPSSGLVFLAGRWLWRRLRERKAESGA